jgi:hypothetical protein
VLPSVRRDIDNLIKRERSHTRSDYTDTEVQLYARSLVVALTGTWSFSALHVNIHLYRDVRWDQPGIERYRLALEEVFGVQVPSLQFFCARTIDDVCGQVIRALRRDGRIRSLAPPAA